jgi:hypothetical protein
MSRGRRKYPKPRGLAKGERYMKIPHAMAWHPNWRTLPGIAVKVYLELFSRYNGFNNGELHLGCHEGKNLLGVSADTIHRALKRLTERGWIELSERGNHYLRKASEWRLTSFAAGEKSPTYAWRQWQPKAKSKNSSTSDSRDRKSARRPTHRTETRT